ncbi:putative bifunctional diguanylate cyclase/phosphodiesterase [Exiguobacterium sp. BMC-KP]|uniref:putative bifunctional diguanylate cyclase/phosphodiesterase n=1 Tax=Exiguobacterium sp. BMC-KP TaxID=1684312 RepID=UPI0006AA2D53|nr:bifunctional diguanylate cyclase/phosphodiesterase [Exiguobacterium sp. BMC-KP]
MNSVTKWPFLILIGISVMFWYGNMVYEGSEWIRLTFLNTIQLIIGIVSTFWILRLLRSLSTSLKLFWLFLSMGTGLSFIGTLVWIINLTITKQAFEAPPLSYFLWALCYICYFIALLYRLRRASIQFANMTYFFNTMIYMIAAISISYYYLLYPLYRIEEHSLGKITYTVIFQIADLGILFFIITLFYLIQFNKKNKSLNYLIIGLFLQILGDMLFAQMMISENYQSGKVVDFVWTIALLFIGCSAYFYKDESKLTIEPRTAFFPTLKKEFLFPYLSILVLSILMMESYDWSLNALSFGWIMIFLLIIVRQGITTSKNNRLVLKLNEIAYTDMLTKLGNRAAFFKETQYAMDMSQQDFTFILLQVERVKMFNDVFGHQTGEKLIKEVSNRLKHTIDMNVKLYRFSEDEFMIVTPHKSIADILLLNESIFNVLQPTFKTSDFELNIIGHIGITHYPKQSISLEKVQQHTAEALYQAKQYGNYSFVIYNNEIESNLLRKLEMESHLKNAINNNQLSVYYQPKIDLTSGCLVGMEALLRWEHPKFGWISPAEFIPLAEETGLINEIGEWVLYTAAQHNKQLQRIGFKPLLVSVNVSALQFQNPHFCSMVGEVLAKTKLDPEWLELEITESIVQNIKESFNIMQQIKSMGIKISIDDFGTGYSSLNVLEQLPIDTLKIDKSFIDRVSYNNPSPMVKTIIELALNLELNVVAEGIETVEQKEILYRNGCMIGQGYLFSRPVDYYTFVDFLTSYAQSNVTSS